MPNWKDFLDPDAPIGRYLRWKEVERSAGISRTTAWRLQRAGDFPRPYVISPGRVGYLEAEVDAWRTSRGHRGVARAARPTPLVAAPAARPPTAAQNDPAAASPAARRDVAAPHPRGPKRRPGGLRSTTAQLQLDL